MSTIAATVCTAEELYGLLESGTPSITVHLKHGEHLDVPDISGTRLTVEGDGSVTVRGTTSITVKGCIEVESHGVSRVVAREHSRVVARGLSARDHVEAVATRSASVEAHGSADVVAYHSSTVVSHGTPRVRMSH